MVDIETLDTAPSAAIVAIGAVVFDPRGEGFNENDLYSVTIDRDSNLFHGRTICPKTEAWWSIQSEEAQQAVFGGPHTEYSTALREFVWWVNRQQPCCTTVWAKDPDFDVQILIHACRGQQLMWPFKFWSARSCRTARDLAYPEGDFPLMAIEGPKHDALADAKLQVLEIQHAYHVLGV